MSNSGTIKFMRRKLLITGMVLLAIAASSVRISYHALGWGVYWGVDLVAPSKSSISF